MNTSTFQEKLISTNHTYLDNTIKQLLIEKFCGAEKVEKATQIQDKSGTDYWVYFTSNRAPVSVDVKLRDTDPKESFNSNDLALETLSVVETETLGWTMNDSKHTDFVIWYFKPTKRVVIIPFLPLCLTMKTFISEWRSKYKIARQRTINNQTGEHYHSECVFVPLKEIKLKMFSLDFF